MAVGAETLLFDYWRQHQLRIKVARIRGTRTSSGLMAKASRPSGSASPLGNDYFGQRRVRLFVKEFESFRPKTGIRASCLVVPSPIAHPARLKVPARG
jgi:hypothetical protein